MAYQNELATESTELIKNQEQEILNRNSAAVEQLSQQLTETAKKRREVESLDLL